MTETAFSHPSLQFSHLVRNYTEQNSKEIKNNSNNNNNSIRKG